ncbi:MAG: hypothetical protein KC549_00795, partial [Myxococcales bacterium]|nr:hypothetical protein [Myxococcales bacterium]
AGRLQAMAVNDDERLFGPIGEQIQPRPFDDEGPMVRLFVAPWPDGGGAVSGDEAPREGQMAGREVVAGGTVHLRFLVRDDAAIGVRADGSPEVAIALLGDAPPIALELVEQPALFGIQAEVEVHANLHTGRLPAEFEGARLPVQVVARDALGRESREVFYIRIDREAPRLLLTPPPGVGMPNADAARLNLWYTNHVGDELHFHLSVRDATPVNVTATFGAEDLLHAAAAPGVDVDLPLHTGVRGEGVHQLTVTATDALGYSTSQQVDVFIDRTPPRYEPVLTSYLDEGLAQARCEADACTIDIPVDSPEISLDPAQHPGGVIPVRKVATRLGAGDPNAVVLRWRVEDPAPGCEACADVRATPDQLIARLGDEVLEPVENARGERALVLDAERLGLADGLVDASTPWPPQDLPPLTLTDLAGNQTVIDIPRFSLEILPPPLVIEAVVPAPQQFVDNLQELTVAGLVDAANEGRGVRIGAWQLRNPWPLQVAWTIAAPPPATLTIDTVVEPERPEDVLGVDLAAASGDGWSKTQISNGGCLFRWNPMGAIEPNPNVEAIGVETLVLQDDGSMAREIRIPGCRVRQFRDVGPIVVEVPWSVGHVRQGRVEQIRGWTDHRPAQVVDIEARFNWLPLGVDAATVLGGGLLLDDVRADLGIRVLYWDPPPPGCLPDVGRCGGWTFTRRIRRHQGTVLTLPALSVREAADCVELACESREPLYGILAGPVDWEPGD